MNEITRLTSEQAADYIGVSRTGFWKLFKKGYLDGTYYTVVSRRIFIKDMLDEWMRKGGSAQYE